MCVRKELCSRFEGTISTDIIDNKEILGNTAFFLCVCDVWVAESSSIKPCLYVHKRQLSRICC